MMCIIGYWASMGRFYNRLRHFTNAQTLVSIRCPEFPQQFVILSFSSLLNLSILLHAIFALIILVTTDVVYVNSVRFKHIDSSCHFLKLNYRGLNLDLLKLKQLLLDGDTVSNPGPTQIDCKP